MGTENSQLLHFCNICFSNKNRQKKRLEHRTIDKGLLSVFILYVKSFLKQQAFCKEFWTEHFLWLCKRRKLLSRCYRVLGKTEPAVLSNLLGVFQISFWETKHKTKTSMVVIFALSGHCSLFVWWRLESEH